MVSGRAWEERRQGASWPGLPELIWNRRVHAAGWAGCRASGPLGFYPPNHGWSSRVTARCPQLPACPLCLQALMGVGRSFLHSGGSFHSRSPGSSSLPSALGHPFSRQPILCSPINRSHSLGPQSRQDPGEVDLEVGKGQGQGQQAPSEGLGQRLSPAPSGSRSWQEAQAQSQPHRLIRD